jgi:hypothetical protein
LAVDASIGRMNTIEIADIEQLQAEMGKLQNQLTLRAIIAERRVRELEAELAALQPKTWEVIPEAQVSEDS